MKSEARLLKVYMLTILSFLIISFLGDSIITVMAEDNMRLISPCIIIDPGHGGEDGGAISCTGDMESHYNLEISIRLNDLLTLLGYRTKMIRTEDVSVYTTGTSIAQKKRSDLRERVRIVNECRDAILLSLHQNHFSDSRYSGAQIFFADTEGSRALAEKMQEQFIFALNRSSNRKAKKSSGIFLMEHIQCPGVLIECGFLSNREENAKLKTSEYQKKICCVIASSVSLYISNT